MRLLFNEAEAEDSAKADAKQDDEGPKEADGLIDIRRDEVADAGDAIGEAAAKRECARRIDAADDFGDKQNREDQEEGHAYAAKSAEYAHVDIPIWDEG